MRRKLKALDLFCGAGGLHAIEEIRARYKAVS